MGVYKTHGAFSRDATVQQCAQLGGEVCVSPMDIPGVGRMAVLQDPQGAMISAIT